MWFICTFFIIRLFDCCSQLTETWWHIYAWVNLFVIDWGNGLLPVWQQVITLIIVYYFSVEPLETTSVKLVKLFKTCKSCIKEGEGMHLKMASVKYSVILFQPQYVILDCHFNLLMLKPEYSQQTKPILWLLMPWLLLSPASVAIWNWLCMIERPSSSMSIDLNNLFHLSVKNEDEKNAPISISLKKYSPQQQLINSVCRSTSHVPTTAVRDTQSVSSIKSMCTPVYDAMFSLSKLSNDYCWWAFVFIRFCPGFKKLSILFQVVLYSNNTHPDWFRYCWVVCQWLRFICLSLVYSLTDSLAFSFYQTFVFFSGQPPRWE